MENLLFPSFAAIQTVPGAGVHNTMGTESLPSRSYWKPISPALFFGRSSDLPRIPLIWQEIFYTSVPGIGTPKWIWELQNNRSCLRRDYRHDLQISSLRLFTSLNSLLPGKKQAISSPPPLPP